MKIKINGNWFTFFDDIAVSYKLDSIASTFSFKARFNPENASHRDVFRPLAYNTVEIFDNDDNLLFTGTSLNTGLASSNVRSLQVINGYSKSGILEDCSIPYSSYPLEKSNVSLKDIVEVLVSDFDISYVIDPSAANDMNLVYKKTTAQPSESIKNFIAKLAAQRNIIMSHDEKGNLLFFKPDFSALPKLFLNEENTVSMGLKVNGQAMHSTISVIRQPDKDNSSIAPVDTINNSLIGKNRTIVKVLSSGEETATKKAADNVLAEELKNISILVQLKRIENVKVGDTVEVLNPEIYIFERAKLVVSSISVKENNSVEEMALTLVLPETFTGMDPINIFDDANI